MEEAAGNSNSVGADQHGQAVNTNKQLAISFRKLEEAETKYLEAIRIFKNEIRAQLAGLESGDAFCVEGTEQEPASRERVARNAKAVEQQAADGRRFFVRKNYPTIGDVSAIRYDEKHA
jgi:hypothetical protein